MEETRDYPEQAENAPSTSWPSDFAKRFGSVSLASQEDTLSQKEANCDTEEEDVSSQTASEIFWCTGILSEPITDGFYSVVSDIRLTEMFQRLPTLEELSQLQANGYMADVIVVDARKDKKLLGLKQLTAALIKGLNSNPPAIIKKIAGLVSDFYKRPNLELSPGRAALQEPSQTSIVRGFQMLGQLKHSSCCPRAILFKFLADTVGLETRLMMGLPNEGEIGCTDIYKHMSVVVTLNSVELLIDLVRFPGKLRPLSTKAIFMTHISAVGDSDSTENDSCDSPLEPNSPHNGFSSRFGSESHAEKDDIVRHPRRLDTSANTFGLSFQSKMQRSASALSLSHSERNVATSHLQRSWGKVIVEQHAASSSPENPSFRAHGRSMLGAERKSPRDYGDDGPISRSGGAPSPEALRLRRRRSISITPEIGDEIVRAVRAMNETLKQNSLLREQVGCIDTSLPSSPNIRSTDHQKNHGEASSQRGILLPSSPHEFSGPNSEMNRLNHVTNEMVLTWNTIMEGHLNDNKSLLPYAEWNIDFSELTVGTRVGIGVFGEVFRGIWNGTEVAIKLFLEQDLTAENMEDFCNEISILSRLRHPNVILFLGACTKPPHLSMFTEYMEMGSLYFLIHMSGQKLKLSWRRRLKMLRDICRGLMCIHRMKIVHRDLKSANCLVNKHWTVKICDFGLSRIMSGPCTKDTQSAGTPEWMAPELIRNEPLTDKCDIFSLGVIMWELWTLRRPWEGVTAERVVCAVANEGSRLEIPEGPLGELIADCWGEPNDRPSCKEILARLTDCE